MKHKILAFIVIAVFIFISVTGSSSNHATGVAGSLSYFKERISLFAQSSHKLSTAIQEIDASPLSVARAREALKNCRLDYKRMGFFAAYFFPSETSFYNAAPKYEVEEPELELVEPMGLQQIEALLFDDDVLANKPALMIQAGVILSSAEDLNTLLYNFQANDAQILESLRIELIRISVLYISGYDAPLLKTGIVETAAATAAIQEVLKPYIKVNSPADKALDDLITNSLAYLTAHPDFDTFNRMEYLKKFALPMQKELGQLIKREGLEINTTRYLNYNAPDIYSKEALISWADSVAGNVNRKELAAFGKQLFFDKSLSGNLSVSCATCHQPENYFTDLLPKSPSLKKDSILKRNTPTLLYASWQHTQFWDGRANDLESQVHTVIFNPVEMGGTKERLYQNVVNKNSYKKLISASFPEKKITDIGVNEISEAIAAFVKQLNPMDSPFDRYLRGEPNTMTKDQLAGFNLFMGKAQCGTCHFAPYFNSLLPPFYNLSEVEILGTTKTDDFNKPELDPDSGRQELYNIRYYSRAFKTPTVRNAAKTAPYMHNGSFGTLAKVLDFYNKGGGNGLGLKVEDQTLASKPLNLSDKEVSDIISFIESLTDPNTKTHNYLN